MIVHHLMMHGRYVRLLLRSGKRPLAYLPDSREEVEPMALKGQAEMIAPPPGPLGPRPVVLSYRLVQCWLPEEEWPRWRMAGVIPAGQRAMIERIEREILDLEAQPDFADLLIGSDLGDEPPALQHPLDGVDWRDIMAIGDEAMRRTIESFREAAAPGAGEADPPPGGGCRRRGRFDPELDARRSRAAHEAEFRNAIPCTFGDPDEDQDDDEEEPASDRAVVTRVASGRPLTYWGGERQPCRGALPEFLEGEVEIVSIRLNSVMGDLKSVRARRDGDKIRYRVVDEYHECDEHGELINDFSCRPDESSLPLTVDEIKELLWSIEVDGYGQIFTKAWEEQLDGPIEDYENDFYYLLSDFYHGLQRWLEERFDDWKRRKIAEMNA